MNREMREILEERESGGRAWEIEKSIAEKKAETRFRTPNLFRCRILSILSSICGLMLSGSFLNRERREILEERESGGRAWEIEKSKNVLKI